MNNLSAYDFVSQLGIRYKKYRKTLKVTQNKKKKKTGITTSTISQFENGHGQGLSLYHAVKLFQALDLPVNLEIIPEMTRTNLSQLWKKQNKEV